MFILLSFKSCLKDSLAVSVRDSLFQWDNDYLGPCSQQHYLNTLQPSSLKLLCALPRVPTPTKRNKPTIFIIPAWQTHGNNNSTDMYTILESNPILMWF